MVTDLERARAFTGVWRGVRVGSAVDEAMAAGLIRMQADARREERAAIVAYMRTLRDAARSQWGKGDPIPERANISHGCLAATALLIEQEADKT